jgi:hypothetical protein
LERAGNKILSWLVGVIIQENGQVKKSITWDTVQEQYVSGAKKRKAIFCGTPTFDEIFVGRNRW